MLFNTEEFNRCITVITWGFHVCGSHCLPHINLYTIAGFLPPEHLPVLHLGEGEGHCESTVGAFHYAKLTGQRSVGTPEENGTTFSD